MPNFFPVSRRSFLLSCTALNIFDSHKAFALGETSEIFKPFSFVFLTDCHLSPNNSCEDSYKLTRESQLFLQQTVKQINLLKPDFVIFGGDQVDGPGDEDTNWQFFLDVMQLLDCPWYFVLGEADVSGNLSVNKMRTYGRDWAGSGLSNNQPYWSYDPLPGIHLIGLDTSVSDTTIGYISNEQLDWLKNDLAQQKSSLTIIISHHPLLAPPPYYQNSQGSQYLLPQDSLVRDILNADGNEIIAISGHVHINKLTRQNNVCYISSPSLDIYPCAFQYFQISPKKMEVQTQQVNFPALIKKAKDNLLKSNLVSSLTEGLPHNFVNLALGSRNDQNTSLALGSGKNNDR